MRLFIKTVLFHLICIVLFTFIYFHIGKHFVLLDNSEFSLVDCILLSSTIQSGVGVSGLVPVTNVSKMVITLQQIILIMTYVFTIYIFTV